MTNYAQCVRSKILMHSSNRLRTEETSILFIKKVNPGGPALAEPVVVPRHGAAADGGSLAYSVAEGSPLPSGQLNLAPSIYCSIPRPIAGQSVGRNELVVKFLRGTRRLNSPCPHMVYILRLDRMTVRSSLSALHSKKMWMRLRWPTHR